MHHDEAMHQMSNDQFELPLEGTGEARSGERSGEAVAAIQGDERSGLDTLQLMERIVEGGNLRRALKRVQQNKGSPGVDGRLPTICATTGQLFESNCSRVAISRAW